MVQLQVDTLPTEEDSEKLELLRDNSKMLTFAMKFDIMWLAGEMNRNGLLSDGDFYDVLKIKSLLSDTDRAEIMLTSLKRKVALNSKHLDTFLGILKSKPGEYSDATAILKGK